MGLLTNESIIVSYTFVQSNVTYRALFQSCSSDASDAKLQSEWLLPSHRGDHKDRRETYMYNPVAAQD